MLKTISPLISPELLKVLAEMGHGDEIIFSDAHFPAHSMGPQVIRADGLRVSDLLQAIIPLFELDSYAPPVVMMAAVEQQQPPRVGRTRPKLRYAHQGGMNPPVIVIHGNSLDAVSDSYKRYLEGVFRDAFNLAGTPLRVELKTGRNPYAEDEKKK